MRREPGADRLTDCLLRPFTLAPMVTMVNQAINVWNSWHSILKSRTIYAKYVKLQHILPLIMCKDSPPLPPIFLILFLSASYHEFYLLHL